MIEPIRGQLYAYDVSCSACGVVERFEDLRLIPHMFLPKLAAKGWRVLGGLHYCSECRPRGGTASWDCGPIAMGPPPARRQTTRLSISDKDLGELFGIELVSRAVGAA